MPGRTITTRCKTILSKRTEMRARALHEQATIYAAGETPLHLLNQIEAEEMEIRRIEEQLRALEDKERI